MDTIGARIKFAREAAGISQEALARALGINRVSVSNWETESTRPDLDKIPALAEALGTTEAWLSFAQGAAPPQRKQHRLKTDPASVAIVPGTALLGTGRMPVYAAAMGGNGHVIVTFDAVDTVKRPAELENVRGGYGLLITGESMIPAFWPGDMALVNPHLSPARMKNVILYHTPPNSGEVEAMVKQLNGWTDKEWVLQQYNPMKEFREYRQEWPICHRVVGRYDAR